MKNLTIKNLTEVCSGTYHGPENVMDREVSSITTDSRKIEKDSLFVPIVGERVDAHRFIPDVMSKGALVTAESVMQFCLASSSFCLVLLRSLSVH